VSSEALADLEALYQRQVATLKVAPDSDAWSALSQRSGTESSHAHLRVHYTDAEVFASELCSFGDDVVVVDPPQLRNIVLENLRKLVGDHA
jgi:proteasome accessory factor B